MASTETITSINLRIMLLSALLAISRVVVDKLVWSLGIARSRVVTWAGLVTTTEASIPTHTLLVLSKVGIAIFLVVLHVPVALANFIRSSSSLIIGASSGASSMVVPLATTHVRIIRGTLTSRVARNFATHVVIVRRSTDDLSIFTVISLTWGSLPLVIHGIRRRRVTSIIVSPLIVVLGSSPIIRLRSLFVFNFRPWASLSSALRLVLGLIVSISYLIILVSATRLLFLLLFISLAFRRGSSFSGSATSLTRLLLICIFFSIWSSLIRSQLSSILPLRSSILLRSTTLLGSVGFGNSTFILVAPTIELTSYNKDLLKWIILTYFWSCELRNLWV